MNRFAYLAPFLIVVALSAAEISEKFGMRIESTEANYQSAVQKADNVRFYAVQKAAAERLKSLKSALSDATKAGDFDAATKVKELITAAEAGATRPKPKQTVKFAGHEYAIIDQKAPWHVAVRLCEQMGGHLATLETPAEWDGVSEMCRQAKVTAWIGATDEEVEGKWRWVTGQPVTTEFRKDNASDSEHAMAYWLPSNAFDDNGSDARHPFVCEWDK